jgi:hypothetical protein
MPTTTALTASPNPAAVGKTVTFTATVTPANGVVVPNGSLTFTIDGKTATTQALNNTGVAGYATSTLTAGQHTVSAAYAGNSSFAASTSASLTETINSPQAAAPVFSPAVGTYSTPQQVTITDSTPNAVIYYTVNGANPTTSSTKYTGAITVSTTTTIKAIAMAAGYSQSIVSAATYTIALAAVAPTFTPKAGTYGQAQLVTLATVTPNATIYYTTDGSAPTASSTKYTKPFAVNATETIKAIATASGLATSPASSALYTLVASPQVFTGLATNITEVGATLNATVNDHNVGATVWFQWGTSSTALTSALGKLSLGASPDGQPVSSSLIGLSNKTTYYFRPVINTVGGTSYGAIQSFTTQ